MLSISLARVRSRKYIPRGSATDRKLKMFADFSGHLEDDHVVPDQSVFRDLPQGVALYSHALLDPSAKAGEEPKQVRRQDSDLWADIEDLLALEQQTGAGISAGAQTSDHVLSPHDASPTPPLSTPDFDQLIETKEPEAIEQKVPLVTCSDASSTARGGDSGGKVTDTSANQRSSGSMDTLLQIRNSLFTDCGVMDTPQPGSDLLEDVDSFMQGGQCGVVLEERIRYACTILDIPMDPNLWTVDQVQKWAMFVLKREDGAVQDPESIMSLTIDGATLTQMTKDDLVTYFPTIGETLYNELEVWCFGRTSPLTSSMTSQLTSQPEYVDLDNFTKMKPCDVTVTSPYASQLDAMTSSSQSVTQSDDAFLPPLRSAMNGCCYVKAEVPEMMYIKPEIGEQELGGAPSPEGPTVPPSAAAFSNYASYSPSSTSSCGNSSADDLYDDHESTARGRRQVLPSHGHGGKHTIQLWQFLKNLLLQPQYENYIRWLDRGKGIFKIEDSAYVAKLWGRRKNRPAMNYDKLSRSIRQYYKKGIIKKTGQSKRLVYQFCPQYNS